MQVMAWLGALESTVGEAKCLKSDTILREEALQIHEVQYLKQAINVGEISSEEINSIAP